MTAIVKNNITKANFLFLSVIIGYNRLAITPDLLPIIRMKINKSADKVTSFVPTGCLIFFCNCWRALFMVAKLYATQVRQIARIIKKTCKEINCLLDNKMSAFQNSYFHAVSQQLLAVMSVVPKCGNVMS